MAKFEFRCPQCGYPVSGEEEWRGMEAPCPYCKKTILIPVDENTVKEYAEKTPVIPNRKRLKISIIIALVGAVLAIILNWCFNVTPEANVPQNADSGGHTAV